MPTLAERQAIARQMQALAWDFVPMVVLGQYVSPAAMRTNAHGLIGMPNVVPFWNVSKSCRGRADDGPLFPLD